MTTPIKIESLEIQGFRAYLSPQSIPFRRGNTPISIAVFAPNAKGKSSLVDSLEYYFSEDATLERLGKRAVHQYAGPQAVQHVAVDGSSVSPEVKVQFRQGHETFSGVRRVANNSARPDAAQRVLSSAKVPFIIRGYELRSFVDSKTPDQQYKEIAGWFALDPLVAIQTRLRRLRRLVKAKVESRDEVNVRLGDLRRVTESGVSDWDEASVCRWVNDHILSELDPTLRLTEISDTDAGYLTLVERKSAEDEQIGVAALRTLISQIEAIAKPNESTEPSVGSLHEFQNTLEELGRATKRQEDEGVKATNSVFSEIWTCADHLLRDSDIDLDKCPVCDTPFQSSPHGSRASVHIEISRSLDVLKAYREATTALHQTNQKVARIVDELRKGILEGV